MDEQTTSGVPVFRAVTTAPTLTAELVFRCGVLDETPATHGWTHLAEHLTLHDLPAGPDLNGSTEPLFTTFTLTGKPEAVHEGLRTLCARLATPSADDVAAETRVLRAERAWRGAESGVASLIWRYGMTGPGLLGFSDLGLGRASWEMLTEFMRPRFTAGNAALALIGPATPTPTLDLPEGPRMPCPPLPPPDAPTPAWHRGAEGVTVSQVLPSGPAGDLYPRVLADVVWRECRAAWWSPERPSMEGFPATEQDELFLLHTRVGGHATAVDPELGRALHPTPEQVAGPLADVQHQLRHRAGSEAARAAHAASAAREHLLGHPVRTEQEKVAALLAVTPGMLVSLAERVYPTTLVGVSRRLAPPALAEVEVPASGGAAPWPSGPGLRELRPSRAYALRWRLRISDTEISIGTPADHTTLRLDELSLRGRRSDGSRILLDVHGSVLSVEPSLMEDPGEARAAVDALRTRYGDFDLDPRPPSSTPRPPTHRAALRYLGGRLMHRLRGARRSQ